MCYCLPPQKWQQMQCQISNDCATATRGLNAANFTNSTLYSHIHQLSEQQSDEPIHEIESNKISWNLHQTDHRNADISVASKVASFQCQPIVDHRIHKPGRNKQVGNDVMK